MSHSEQATLGTVLAAVGPTLIQPMCMPRGPDVAVTEPSLLDIAVGISRSVGALLLAVGCRPGSQTMASVISQAADGGYAAVVVKGYGDVLDPVISAAESARIALILADETVSWARLHTLLSAASKHGAAGQNDGKPGVVIGDLFALANAVAAMVGGAISIEDPHQNMLAYSNVPGQPIDEVRKAGILGRRVPAEFRLADLYGRVRRSESVERVILPGLRDRLAVEIRAGDEPIGSIWAVEGDSGFAPDAERALMDTARIASVHILRLRTTADVARAARAAALQALLLGGRTPAVEALPISSDQDMTVMAFRISTARDATDNTVLERVADLVALYCESLDRRAACLTLGETVYALLPTGRGAHRALPAFAERLLSRAAGSLSVELCAGIGSTVEDLAGVARSRQEADLVLHVLAERDDGRSLATIADVRSRAIILQLHEVIDGDSQFQLEVLKRMTAYDAEKSTGYVETLRTYLDCFGDVPTASVRMFLHQNTFRHRMRRMTEIFDLALDDPDERLVLWLLLRVCS
ncbi:MAG: helix-turn-helix domain-containing protein [Nakamurella sp.]